MYPTQNKKVLNTKKGIANDGWKTWVHAPEGHFAGVELTDSMIKESIMSERKVDCRDIRHKIVLVYLRPWTGFRDNTTENSSVYVAYMKKLYWEGRIDQFLIAEMVPGKDPIIHDFDRATMNQKARDLGMVEEATQK